MELGRYHRLHFSAICLLLTSRAGKQKLSQNRCQQFHSSTALPLTFFKNLPVGRRTNQAVNRLHKEGQMTWFMADVLLQLWEKLRLIWTEAEGTTQCIGDCDDWLSPFLLE